MIRSLLGDVDTILDLDHHGGLGDLTVPAPGHTGTGQAVHADAGGDQIAGVIVLTGELGDQSLADVLGAHVGGNTGGLAGLIDGVHAVIAVSGELVGDAAVGFLVLGNEGDGALILAPGVEGGHEHQALGQSGIEALQIQDAVHAVTAEEGGLEAQGLGLVQNQRGGGVVNGQEHQIGFGILGLGQLHGEIGVGVIGEGGHGDNLQADLIGGSLEGIVDTGGVGVAVVVDDGHLAAQVVILDVVGGGNALVGVGEADLEHVVLTGGNVGGGSGGGQLEVAGGVGLSRHGHTGGGSGAAVDDLGAVADEGVVGVDGLLGITLVVLEVQLKLEATQGVDLLHGHLGALLGGKAIHSGGAGQGANAADLNGAGGRAGTGLNGSSLGGARLAGSGSSRVAGAAAAGQKRQAQRASQCKRQSAIHVHCKNLL